MMLKLIFFSNLTIFMFATAWQKTQCKTESYLPRKGVMIKKRNIFIDILTMDGLPMEKRIADSASSKIWTALGQDETNIHILRCVLIPHQGCRIKIKSHHPIHLDSISSFDNRSFLIWDCVPIRNINGLDMIDMTVYQANLYVPI